MPSSSPPLSSFLLFILVAGAALSPAAHAAASPPSDASASSSAESARTAYPASASSARSGWNAVSPAPASSKVDLLFALRHSPAQLADLSAAASRASDPSSAEFRQYLSRSQVQQRFAPAKEAEEIVVAFLREQLGIADEADHAAAAAAASADSNSNHAAAADPLAAAAAHADTNAASAGSRATIAVLPGGWVRARGVSVSQASSMLHTEFAVWERSVSEEEAARARQQPLRSASGDPIAVAMDHSSSAPLIRSQSGYSLPSDVAAHVDFVGGVTKLPTMRFNAQMISSRRVVDPLSSADNEPTNGSNREDAPALEPSTTIPPAGTPAQPAAPSSSVRFDQAYTVTPAFLREMYHIPSDARGSFRANNRQVVPQFLEQYYSERDLKAYLEKHDVRVEPPPPPPAGTARDDPRVKPDANDSGTNPWIPVPAVPASSRAPTQNISRVLGPNDPSNPGGEASLDTQLALGLAPGVLTEVWSFPGRRDNSQPPSNFNQEPFLDWLVLLAGMDNPPLVHSISYADDEKDCTDEYMARLDAEFQKAALRGISILFASGDDGAGSVDSRSDLARGCKQHNPNFPSSSPWITSVGGTQLGPSKNRDQSPRQRGEIVSSARTGSAITTGGGFSHFFARPAYQARAVQTYLERAANASASSPSSRPILPPSSWFNTNGRSYPDLSALATNYEIFVGGRIVRTGGTSASCPVVAAMVSLLNEHQLSRGQPALGFLNPWIYRVFEQKGTEVFFDVTSGDNACSQHSWSCCPHGFGATAGFDAASGVGTPNFTKLREQL